MNVTIIITRKRSPMVHYTSQLANALSKVSKVTIISPNGTNSDYFKDKVIFKTTLIPGGYFDKNIFTLLNFIRTIKKTKPDIIHIQNNHLWVLLASLFIKKAKIFATLHDPDGHLGERTILDELSRRCLIKFANKIIVHGKNSEQILIKKGLKKQKICIIPHGDYYFFTNYKKATKEEKTTILFFGRIVKYKGL